MAANAGPGVDVHALEAELDEACDVLRNQPTEWQEWASQSAPS